MRVAVRLCRQPPGCWPGVSQGLGRTTAASLRGRARSPGKERCVSSGTGEEPRGTLHGESLGQSSQRAAHRGTDGERRSSRLIRGCVLVRCRACYRISARLTFHVEVFRPEERSQRVEVRFRPAEDLLIHDQAVLVSGGWRIVPGRPTEQDRDRTLPPRLLSGLRRWRLGLATRARATS